MAKTLQQMAQEALQVQDACNLSGVAQAFAKVMIDLGEHTRGTGDRNTHPIAKLWADKIAHLAGTQGASFLEMNDAYDAVHKLAEGEPKPSAPTPDESAHYRCEG